VKKLKMPFDAQPTLTGRLVQLRPLAAGDYEALYAVASDPLIWEQHPVKTRSEPEGFRAFFQESIDSRGAVLVLDRKTGEVIGSSRYHGYDRGKSEVEIGWTFLARSRWGGRYNGEMKDLMLRHAFRFVENVLFLVGIDNLRSQRALEKIGGVRIGSRPDANGKESHVYRIRAAEFESGGRPAGQS